MLCQYVHDALHDVLASYTERKHTSMAIRGRWCGGGSGQSTGGGAKSLRGGSSGAALDLKTPRRPTFASILAYSMSCARHSRAEVSCDALRCGAIDDAKQRRRGARVKPLFTTKYLYLLLPTFSSHHRRVLGVLFH